jgi:adenosylcobyric acid synthase
MVMGTASHVGKTFVATGLCRLLANRGYRVAPFKAQNMSTNATATPDGREIAWSQYLQAEAARAVPDADMNPVLLKPNGPDRMQVVVQGRAMAVVDAGRYLQADRDALFAAVEDSYRRLAARYDVIVIEGAGSPVEMNSKARDLANMRTAALADAIVWLVADIEWGGSFAAVVGTLALLTPAERARVRGLIINKFRGNPEWFADGRAWLARETGVPVLGVLPYLPTWDLEEEDGARPVPARPTPAVTVAAVRLPHLANAMDLDPLTRDARVRLNWVTDPTQLGHPDAIVLPGTTNTMEDLRWLHTSGWHAALLARHRAGVFLLGLCGGYQMLGRRVADPFHVESAASHIAGLGVLPVSTTLRRAKTTRWVDGLLQTPFPRSPVRGYEIHLGETRADSPVCPLVVHGTEADGALAKDGAVIGTYLHGILDNAAFRDTWLAQIAQRRKRPWDPHADATDGPARRERLYEEAARILADHLDLQALSAILPPVKEGAV